MAGIVQPPEAPQQIVFVTGNAGKLAEMQALLGPHGIQVIGDARGYPEIQADTLEEVARQGARALLGQGLRPPFLLEDAGLFIGALKGFPGVYSRYAYDTVTPAGILRLMQDLEPEQRQAAFQACIAYVDEQAQIHVYTGSCRGFISDQARGTHGFGFDPIFIPEGDTRTFAELDDAEKAARSHRGAAALAFLDALTASAERP